MNSKLCSACKQNKPLDQFNRKKLINSIGYQSQCRKCQSKTSRRHHESNRDIIRERKRRRVHGLRRDYRNWLLPYLDDRSCIDCGESDIIVLQFDHVRGKKKFNISNAYNYQPIKGKNLKNALPAILKEIHKCEVVCANCHQKRTAKQQGWYKLQPVA